MSALEAPVPKATAATVDPAALLQRALELDVELMELAQWEGQADRQMGRGLALIWQDRRHLALGRSRPIVFVREELGMKESRARWLARLGRTLLAVPEIDRAHAEGQISAAQVVVLAGIVDAATPAEERVAWIERATRMTVRSLARAVQAEKRRRTEEVAGAEAASPAPEKAAADDAGAVDATVADATEAPPAGGWMTITASARTAFVWQETVELARKASGHHLTQGQCAEAIFAEYLSANPEAAAEDNVPAARDPLVAEVLAALESGRARLATESPSPEPAQAPLPSTDVEDVPPPGPNVESPPQLPEDYVISETLDPFELATTLKRLSALKKTIRYDLAAGLARLHETGGWALLGYRSFEEYCTTRLGFGVRRGEQLIRFHAGLEKFPRLRASYLHERMSYTAALLLLPILHPSTERAWLAWIDGDEHVPSDWKPGPNRITYREIERVAEYARMYALPGASPSVLAAWVKGLAEQGLVTGPGVETGSEANAFIVDSCAETPNPDEDPVPTGYSLPPARDGDLPTISGVPPELVFTAPEREVARIRFWLPQDALTLAQRALDHARRTAKDPLQPTWFYFEQILVHFIRTIDNPVARAANRRHPIIMRDGFCASSRAACVAATSTRTTSSQGVSVGRTRTGTRAAGATGTMISGSTRAGSSWAAGPRTMSSGSSGSTPRPGAPSSATSTSARSPRKSLIASSRSGAPGSASRRRPVSAAGRCRCRYATPSAQPLPWRQRCRSTCAYYKDAGPADWTALMAEGNWPAADPAASFPTFSSDSAVKPATPLGIPGIE